MGLHGDSVHQQVLQVSELNEGWLHPLPNAPLAPTVVALINAVPLAVARGQSAPLRARTSHPQHRFDQLATSCFLTDITVQGQPNTELSV